MHNWANLSGFSSVYSSVAPVTTGATQLQNQSANYQAFNVRYERRPFLPGYIPRREVKDNNHSIKPGTNA